MRLLKYLIIFLLVWSAISDFFASKVSVLGYVDELIVLVLLIDLVLGAITNVNKTDNKIVRLSKTGTLIALLIFWSIGSFIINWSSFTQLFKFVFSISKGFIIFYWIKTFLRDTRIVHKILTVIKWLIIIQIPFFIIGLAFFGTSYFGDNAVGAVITGDASAVGTFFWMGILICIAKYDQNRNSWYLIYMFALICLLIVTSTKQLTILLPVVLLYLYGRRIKISQLKQIAYAVLGLVISMMLYNFVERKWMLNYGVDTTEVNLLDYMDESEKLLGYYSLIYELPTEIKHLLVWGAGPGMYGSYVAMNARTPLAQKYIMYYYDLIPEGLGGTLAYRSSSVIGFWGDLGLVGLVLIIAIYAFQTFHYAKKMKTASPRILYNLIVGAGLLLIAQSFILNVFEGNTFTLNLFWILCGISAAQMSEFQRKISSELCI
jgi:hypothetical protein